jgi:hypothetical protein
MAEQGIQGSIQQAHGDKIIKTAHNDRKIQALSTEVSFNGTWHVRFLPCRSYTP